MLLTTGTTDERRYRAVSARDVRFDGQFVTAVRSTGIYCRPSCPARTPRPENVEFYAAAAAAHEAGYRACKRCLPDAVPGSPEWNLRSDVAARAMRLIADGVVEREGVPGLAARLGYSARHLTRLLAAELGAGPLALARAHRAQAARALLVGTDLPAADVAFAAGFASVRQFNDTIAAVYERTPTQLRATRRRGGTSPSPVLGSARPAAPSVRRGSAQPAEVRSVDAPTAAPGTGIDLLLPVREPFDLAGVLAWLAARAVAGVEVAGPESYARALALPGGPATFRVTAADGPGRVRLSARVSALTDVPVLVARVRRLLDLDADPLAVDEVLSTDPALAARVRAVPGIRLAGAIDPHEMLLRAIVGQQVSVAAARTQLSRFVAAAGTPLPGWAGSSGSDGLADPDAVGGSAADGGIGEDRRDPADPPRDPVRLFPTAAQVAEHATLLTGPRARTDTVVRVATALADGSLPVSVGDDPAELRARLLAVPGIGPWTADYLGMRLLGATDVLLTGDVAVRAGARALGLPDAPRDLLAWSVPLSPWRSYACLHLWRVISEVTRPREVATPPASEARSRPDPTTVPTRPPS